MTSNKLHFPIIITALIAVVVYFALGRDRAPAIAQEVESGAQSSIQVKSDLSLKKLPVEPKQETPSPASGIQAEFAQFDSILSKWRSERGYAVLIGNVRAEDYKSYDTETLKRLADSGDGFAVDELAKRAVINGREAVEVVLKKSAIKGSVESLYLAGNYAHVMTRRLESAEARKQGALDALTWFNVAALRGDRSPNLERSSSVLNELAEPLSEKDKQFIKLRSQEIYDDLQRQRTALGLGDFDNSVPPEVKAYFDDIEANVHGLYKR